MLSIIVKAFNLYHHMSPPALRAEWDNIVDNISFTKGRFNDKGVTSTILRRKTWDTLVQCKRTHFLAVCNEDAAERWYTYRTVTIEKPIVLQSNHFGSKSGSWMTMHPTYHA